MPKTNTQSRSGVVKDVVYRHRSYRKIPLPEKKHFIPFLSFVVVIEVLLYIFFPELNHLVNKYARKILVRSIPFGDVELVWTEFLWKPITVLNVQGSYPAPWFSIMNLIVALLLVIVVPRTRTLKPIAVALTLGSLIHLVSAIYFLIIPDGFPYHVLDFSTTFVAMVIITWFLIPIVYFLTLYPLPSSVFSKAFVILATLIWSVTFNIFRYAAILYLINVHSFVFMAILFFCFGILLDMTFIIGFYSFYLSILSKRLRYDSRVWQWLY